MKRKFCFPKIKCPLNFKKVKVNHKVVKLGKIVLILLVIASLAFQFKGLFLVGMVNGRPISRLSFDRLLEKQAGSQILESEITKLLITQEGAKQKVVISPNDLDDKIAEIEKQVESQGSKLDDLLQAQGQTRDELKEQLKLQIVIEKILGKDITIEEKEIADYFDTNKATFAKDATLESSKADIEKDLFQQKLSEKFTPWLTDLRAKAKILYFVKF